MTYFGHTTVGASPAAPGIYTFGNDAVNIIYTCPGTGLQDVKELGAYCYRDQTGHIRMAIYDTSLNFICQGSAELDVATVTPANGWLSHVAFTDVGGSAISPQLTGGVEYVLSISSDSSGPNVYQDTVTAGYERFSYDYTDSTGGFPADLTLERTTDTREWNVRCGVEAAAGGGGSVVSKQFLVLKSR
jgi:hypothetical protein